MAQAQITHVRDQQGTVRLEEQGSGVLEVSGGGRSSVPGKPPASGSCDGRDQCGVHVETANHVVAHDEEITIRGECEVVDANVGLQGRAAIAAVSRRASAGDGGDDAALRIDPADPMVAGVRDEEVAQTVDDDSAREGEPGRRCRATVSAKTETEGRAGHCAHHSSLCIDAANPAVLLVGDEEVAQPVDGDIEGPVELRTGGRATITPDAIFSVPCDHGDGPVLRVHSQHRVAFELRDEEVARCVHRDRLRAVERFVHGKTVVADDQACGPVNLSAEARIRLLVRSLVSTAACSE